MRDLKVDKRTGQDKVTSGFHRLHIDNDYSFGYDFHPS
jgi:hypothetical protein